MFSLIWVWINDWVNNREAGDLRRYRAHYDVIVMNCHKDNNQFALFELGHLLIDGNILAAVKIGNNRSWFTCWNYLFSASALILLTNKALHIGWNKNYVIPSYHQYVVVQFNFVVEIIELKKANYEAN